MNTTRLGNHEDLLLESGPRMLVRGLETLGTVEVPGKESSPVILGWWSALRKIEATKVYGNNFYSDDAIPWCGLWMAFVALISNKPVPRLFLSAREWADWGNPAFGTRLGDVLVFTRKGGGGHVGLYVGEDAKAFHVLGGNQTDAVTITRIDKRRLLAARNFYAIGQPENCRRIWRSPEGLPLSTNEA